MKRKSNRLRHVLPARKLLGRGGQIRRIGRKERRGNGKLMRKLVLALMTFLALKALMALKAWMVLQALMGLQVWMAHRALMAQ